MRLVYVPTCKQVIVVAMGTCFCWRFDIIRFMFMVMLTKTFSRHLLWTSLCDVMCSGTQTAISIYIYIYIYSMFICQFKSSAGLILDFSNTQSSQRPKANFPSSGWLQSLSTSRDSHQLVIPGCLVSNKSPPPTLWNPIILSKKKKKKKKKSLISGLHARRLRPALWHF